MAAAMVVSLVAGCSSTAPSSTKSSTSSVASSAPAAKVTLTMWDYFEGVNSQKGVSALVNGFNSSQSNVTMKAVFTPRDEMDKQLSIGLVSGKLPDIVLIDGCDYASRISMGLFADVTDDFNQDFGSQVSDFYAGPLLTCKSGDKYFGVPFGCNDIGLYYNNDMLKAANIAAAPTTWDEMTADCAKLSNTKTGVYGLAISAIKNDEGSFQFMPWLTSTGATYNKVNTAAGIKSFALLQGLVKDGYMSQESINWTQADAEKQFATGKAAMMINGPWNIAAVQTDAPKLNFSIGPIPKDVQYASVTGGEDMGIIKGHNEAAGWQFLKYATNNSLLYIDDMGYIPSLKSVAAKDTTLDSTLMAPFVSILNYATPRGPSAQWPKISAALYTAEQEVMLNQKTPTDAANEAQASIDSALQ
jgi:multiple sugar transport system substrate-binding protein